MDTSMRDMIIKTYHLESLPLEDQNKMIDQIASLIFQSVLLRAGAKMSTKDQDKLEQMLDQNAGPEELLKFLQNAIPDFEQLVAEESAKFKQESDEVMSKINF